MVRFAEEKDIEIIKKLIDDCLDAVDNKVIDNGWKRGVYPHYGLIYDGVKNKDFIIIERDGEVLASARINNIQDEDYFNCKWKYDAERGEILTLHCLIVSPHHFREGLATEIIKFYIDYGKKMGYKVLRHDTVTYNYKAQMLYEKMGFIKADIFPCPYKELNLKLQCYEMKVN